MGEKTNKPSIRFAGFTDAWERRKARDLFEATADKNHPELPVLAATQEFGMVKRKDNGINIYHDKRNEVTYKKVLPGQFVIHLRSFQGGFAHSAFEGITSPAYTVFGLKAPEKHCDYFWKYIFHSEEFIRRLETVTYGIRDGRSISYEEFLTMNFLVPSYEEQKQISTGLLELDRLIILQQRKYDKLVNIKKSMLEKMFPQHGADVPEIRFAGFTDAWEQRKLKDLSDKVIEKNTYEVHRETFTNSAEFGIISQRDYFDHDISNVENLGNYYMVRDDDFVYNPRISTTAPVGPINRNKLGRIGVMSPLYTVFRTHDIDRTYLEYFFKSLYWHSYMKLNGDSGARSDRFSIKDSVFIEMPIPYPRIKEQEKIGKYLTHLDTLIDLHQRKLTKLQNTKKSCLEKMFV